MPEQAYSPVPYYAERMKVLARALVHSVYEGAKQVYLPRPVEIQYV